MAERPPIDYQARIDRMTDFHFGEDRRLYNRVRELYDEVGPLLGKIWRDGGKDAKSASTALHDFGGLLFVLGAHQTNYTRAVAELEKGKPQPLLSSCVYCRNALTEFGMMNKHRVNCEAYQKLLEERNAPRD